MNETQKMYLQRLMQLRILYDIMTVREMPDVSPEQALLRKRNGERESK